jgi:hypothetical protein
LKFSKKQGCFEMKKTMLVAVVAALSVPAFATQQPSPAGKAVAAGKQAPAPAKGAATPAAPRVLQTYRGQLTFYQMTAYNGDRWLVDTASRAVKTRWPIKSLSIHPGDRWQICARPSFRDCIVVDRSVPDASAIGITNQIGSARPAPADAK